MKIFTIIALALTLTGCYLEPDCGDGQAKKLLTDILNQNKFTLESVSKSYQLSEVNTRFSSSPRDAKVCVVTLSYRTSKHYLKEGEFVYTLWNDSSSSGTFARLHSGNL